MIVTRRSRLAGFAVVLSLAMISSPGEAEEQRTDEADRQLQARRLLELAQELYLQENWLDSGEAFLAAYDAAPVPAVLFNAGQAFRRGGDCDRSLECFRRYVAEDEAMRGDAAVRSALTAVGPSPGEADSCRAVERISRAIFQAHHPAAEDLKAYKLPPRTLPRVEGSHEQDWIDACKSGKEACSNFEVAGPMTEAVLVGNIAIRTGKQLLWNGENMRFTNSDEANEYVNPPARQGWATAI